MSIIRDVIIYNENLFILCLPSVAIAAKKTDRFVFINRKPHNKIKCKRQRARRFLRRAPHIRSRESGVPYYSMINSVTSSALQRV